MKTFRHTVIVPRTFAHKYVDTYTTFTPIILSASVYKL